MRRRQVAPWFVASVLCLPAFAQDKPAKPSPKEKAAELLQTAFDMAPGAQPEVGATALMRIGDNYQGLDDKKAPEACSAPLPCRWEFRLPLIRNANSSRSAWYPLR